MGKLTSIVWREWRDVRGTALGCVALVAAASFIVEHWVFKYAEAEWAAEIFVPLAVLLFAVIVASDLFASDVKTKRIVPLALLPVSLRSVWAGKVCFLAIAIATFCAFVVGLHATILAALGKQGVAAAFIVETGETWMLLLPIAGAAGAVAFYSTLGLRSFVSALFGLSTAGAIMAAVAHLEIDRALELTGEIERTAVPVALIALAAAFLAAGAVAFVRGHGRGRSQLRVAALGFGSLLAFFVPASAATAVQVWRYHHLAPGDREVMIRSFSLSEDERYIVLQVCKDYPRVAGQHRDITGDSYRVWVVRVSDGELFDWSSSRQFLAGWTKGGALWVRSDDWDPENGRVGRWVEPETGKTIRAARSDEYPDELLPRRFSNGERWARIRSLGDPNSRTAIAYEVADRGSDERYEVVSRGRPLGLHERGRVAVCTDEGALQEVDVFTGERRVLVATGVDLGVFAAWSPSPSGRFIGVTLDDGSCVVDLETEAVVLHRPESNWPNWVRSPAGTDLLLLATFNERDGTARLLRGCLDLQTGEETLFEAGLEIGNSTRSVQPLADGGFVVECRKRGIVVLDADGKVVRTLYAKPESTR